MKYLDYPLLTHLSDALSDLPTPEYKIHVRIEAYSVKPIGKERKAFKEMEEAYMSESNDMEEMSFSPEMREAGLSSAFGRLDEKESRKVHFLIVSLLNTAFPDHDFSALRPDQFTRERSAAQVLANLTSNFATSTGNTAPQVIAQVAMSPSIKAGSLPSINQVMSSSLSSSPSMPPPGGMANPDLYRLLSEILPLEESECEVYSWFPEPEYDPHLDPDENELSEDELEEEPMAVDENMADDMDLDDPSWGQAGMELDDVPTSAPMRKASMGSGKPVSPPFGPDSSFSSNEGIERKQARLLWSQNYFFYSRRMKRVLFFSCWCRKRPNHVSSLVEDDPGAFPLTIGSSFSPPSGFATSVPSAFRSPKQRVNTKLNAKTRKTRPNPKDGPARGEVSSTIPIRVMETPRHARLASSAPSHFSTPSPRSTKAALVKMTKGGFKPRQTPARIMLNAAAAAAANNPDGSGSLGGMTSPTGRRVSTGGVGSEGGLMSGLSADRVRKERSESDQPTGSLLLQGIVSPANQIDNSGKRLKVDSLKG